MGAVEEEVEGLQRQLAEAHKEAAAIIQQQLGTQDLHIEMLAVRLAVVVRLPAAVVVVPLPMATHDCCLL